MWPGRAGEEPSHCTGIYPTAQDVKPIGNGEHSLARIANFNSFGNLRFDLTARMII